MPDTQLAAVDTPDFEVPFYANMAPVWAFLSDMLAGQTRVRDKGETYLLKEVGESDQDYKRRLACSLFFEDYRDCVVNLTSRVLRKPPKLNTDVPVEIRGLEEVRDETGNVTQEYREGLAENIDNAGTHLNVFLQRVFEDAFYGHTFIVVDRSYLGPDIKTAADEKASGARSYWCMRSCTDQPNAWFEVINGKTTLTQISFRECTSEPKGKFGTEEVTRYRVYRLDEFGNAEWEIWIEHVDQTTKKKTITLEDTGKILTKRGLPLKRLPVAVHYGEYEGFLRSRPALRGIADINLAYYQKYSDLSNIQHFTCAPTLTITGEDPGGDSNKTLGGNRIIYVPLNGKAEFLEVHGDSIPFLREDLRDLEKRMVHKGLDFVREEHRVPSTATEVTLSFIERTSKLSRMARSLKDCVEDALAITAMMEGLDQGGSMSLGVKESSLIVGAEQIEKYSILNERGQLSRETLWEIMRESDVLPDNFDPVKETTRLKAAALGQMELDAKQFDAGLESTP